MNSPCRVVFRIRDACARGHSGRSICMLSTRNIWVTLVSPYGLCALLDRTKHWKVMKAITWEAGTCYQQSSSQDESQNFRGKNWIHNSNFLESFPSPCQWVKKAVGARWRWIFKKASSDGAAISLIGAQKRHGNVTRLTRFESCDRRGGECRLAGGDYMNTPTATEFSFVSGWQLTFVSNSKGDYWI